jgi:F-type H+-transporting ATPase subunit b
MIAIDSSVFVQIANFLVLIWVLNNILYKPLRGILSERNQKISGLSGNIDALTKEARQKDKEYTAGIRSARSQGIKEKEKLVQAAEQEEKAIIARINEKAQADLLKMKEKIMQDAEVVKMELLKKVDIFATEIGHKILGRAV